MAIKLLELEKAVKLRLGNVSVAKIGADEMSDSIARGIRRFSRLRGSLKLGTWTTVSGQQAYDYDQDVVAKIVDVLTIRSIDELDRFELEISRSQARVIADQGANEYDNPSLAYIRAYKRSSDRWAYEPSWQDATGSVWLIPAPVTDGATVLYIYRQFMTVPDDDETVDATTAIHDNDLDLLVMACQLEALDFLYNFMVLQPQAVNSTGKTVRYDLNAMRKIITDLKWRLDLAASSPTGQIQ